jgi:hypothetical protein
MVRTAVVIAYLIIAAFVLAGCLGDYMAINSSDGPQSKRTQAAARRVFLYPLAWPVVGVIAIGRIARVAIGGAR